MHKRLILRSLIAIWSLVAGTAFAQVREAPAPLFRCPIYDGAADPTVIRNEQDGTWWMLYTQRRASVDAADVAFCYGSAIGIATSSDHGRTWVYRGALELDFEPGHNTFWAPDMVYDAETATYHLFVTYIQGVYSHWGGRASIARYTSRDMWDWKFEGILDLGDENIIDPTVFHHDDGTWRIWYKYDNRTSSAASRDLKTWTAVEGPVISDQEHEGPNIFKLGGWYWMVTDQWAGMGVYRSRDAAAWEKRGVILDKASGRPEDTPSGAHGDVVVVGDKAYIFYFTHPGRATHFAATLNDQGVYPFKERRSSIQVAELRFENDDLVEVREHFDFFLP